MSLLNDAEGVTSCCHVANVIGTSTRGDYDRRSEEIRPVYIRRILEYV